MLLNQKATINAPVKYNFFSRVLYSWRMDVTDSGRALLIGGVFALIIGSVSLTVDTYLLLGFFWGLGVSALLLVIIFRPMVKLKHTLPHHGVCGETLPFSITVENLSKRKGRDIIIRSADIGTFIQILSDGQMIPFMDQYEKQELHLQVKFNSRGYYLFRGFNVVTSFPFGLFLMGRKRQGESYIIIYPRFSPLTEFYIPTGRRYQPGGVALVSNLGDSAEYIGNREYQPGDRLRDIDWRSWARLGVPVVREYQQEYFCRVALVLDTYMKPKKQKKTMDNFEASLSLGAAIADYLSRQEYLIDIFAAGPQIYILEAGRAIAHLDQILEVMACLEPCHQNPFSLIEPVIMERMDRLSTVIVILLDLDEQRIMFLENLIGLGVGLKVIICNQKEGYINRLPFEMTNLVDIKSVTPSAVNQGIESL